jgi:DUF3014 family protein
LPQVTPEKIKPMSPEPKPRGPVLPVVIIVTLAAVVAGIYYFWIERERQATPPPAAPVLEPEVKSEPPIRHPIPQSQPPEARKPLPSLAESDEPIRDATATLIDRATFEKFFNTANLVRRFVVTIEDLPRKKMGQRYNIAKPVAGQFVVAGKGESAAIDSRNYRRYTPYVQIAETIDTKKLVGLYTYFYPLLQEEYKNLGYPKKYFNDRVIEAIDDLLAAPEIKTTIKLTQPKVLYEYADPNLEALSAGQKIMLRMGPDNAARVKAKLQEIRRELATSR